MSEQGEVARLGQVLEGPETEEVFEAAERLLALEGPEAWRALTRRLVRTEPGSPLYELLTEGLGAQGARPAAVLVESLESARGEARCGPLEVLARCGHRDERIYTALVELLAEDAFLGAMHLAAYGDTRAAVPIGEVLDAYPLKEDVADVFAQQTVLELERALVSLGGTLDGARGEKGMTARRLRDAWNQMFDRWRSLVEEEHRRRLGRNDPCWCGSGVKYKRCHLGEDRMARA